MAGLIVKSAYIKPGAAKSAGGYLQYIGTRERVEILPDQRPPTRKQEQLIKKLLTDFPSAKDLPEYEAWVEQPTKHNASQLITQALEENWSAVSSMDGYARYIANRPRVERVGSHGLFGDADAVNLSAVMEELREHDGNVWTHIFSLRREDAARLGYDHAGAWRDLLRSMRSDIAAAMNISPERMRWYAAFHDEGHHPHVHMMVWSEDKREGYLSENGLRQIKSRMTNEIFQMEMLHLYEDKSQARDQMVAQARRKLAQLTRNLSECIGDGVGLELKLMELAEQLPDHGKKTYGYLPKAQKRLVDQIVDDLARFPSVRDCYRTWMELQHQVESYYKDEPLRTVPLSQQKELRSIKNAVIREAECIQQRRISVEENEAGLEENSERSLPDNKQLRELWLETQDWRHGLEYRRKAMDVLRVHAEKGSGYAQYCMGKLYRDGGIVIPDAEIAKAWLEKAAEQNYSPAQYALGKLLLSDDLLVQDKRLGLQWMEAAADNGNNSAMFYLGKESLRSGDLGSAKWWFERAANMGNQYAQYMQGKLYLLEGQEAKSVDFFSMAAEQGNSYAQFFLDRQAQLHPPSVMLAATRLLRSLAKLFQDTAQKRWLPEMRIDRKRRRALMEKRAAMGIRGQIQEDTHHSQSM